MGFSSDEEGLLVRKTHSRPVVMRSFALVLTSIFCLFAAGALADGLMPMMPEPPDTPVYWQLTRVDQEPTITESAGYAVSYEAVGLSFDLSDGLMAESILEKDETFVSGIDVLLEKNGVALKQSYRWNPLPIYLVPDVSYTFDISATEEVAGKTLDTLLRGYLQGEEKLRVSAGGYAGTPSAASLTVDPSHTALYNDGSMVVSFVLREVNGMLRLRVAYTYEMHGGIKPEPTPFPGFLAVPMEDGANVPAFYDAVPGKDGLWVVTTAPDQFRAWGLMTGVGPHFYPADENGRVVKDIPSADPAKDFVQYVQGFVPLTETDTPDAYRLVSPGLFAFTTRDGETMYRAYGRMNGGPAALFPADGAGEVAADAKPVLPEEDYEAYVAGFGHAALAALPPHYQAVGGNVYAFTGRDLQTRYRVYGRLNGAEPAFYPSDEHGVIAPDAKAVTPEDDFANYIKGFDSRDPDYLPEPYYTVAEDLYAVTDRDGNPVYRVFGILDGQPAEFYPATEDGKIVENAAPVTPQADFEAYVKGFEPVAISDDDAPMFYEKGDAPGVWRFTDVNGEAQYRIYGSKDRSEPAFYPSDAQGSVADDALPVQPEADLVSMPPPAIKPALPAETPPYYRPVEGKPGLYLIVDRDGNAHYRAYGAFGREAPAFYPADAEGNAAYGSPAADPALDFDALIKGFGRATPETPPPYYRAVEGGLYAFDGRDGVTRYRSYGRLDGAEPAYYPSDATGTVAPDAAVVSPEDDFTQYIKGFDALTPEALPTFYRVVREGLYAVDDHDGVAHYRVYGILDGQGPALFPAAEDGTPVEGTVAIDPEADLAAYVAGFRPFAIADADAPDYYAKSETPGLWLFTDVDGVTQYRAYGSLDGGLPGFYAANADGEVVAGALPVNPADDYAAMPPLTLTRLTPDAVPPHYQQVDGTPGLYMFRDKEGVAQFRAYGAFGSGEPGFFASDAEGNAVFGDEPADPAQEYAAYAEGFTPATPEAGAMPPHYTIVGEGGGLYQFENREGEKVYRVYGAFDGQAPGFYPADGQGNVTGVVPVAPNDDIALLPTPYGKLVATPAPAVTSGATGVTKHYTPGPEATGYLGAVQPSAGATDPAATVRTSITAGPGPTNYTGAVQPSAGATDPAATVNTEITPGPGATDYTGAVQPSAGNTDPAATVNTDITPGPGATDYASTVEPSATPAGTDATAVAQQQTPAPTETATEVSAQGTATVEPSETNKAQQDPNANGMSVLFIALIAAGLAGIGGAVWFVVSRRKK